eukprot:sb/3475435/
MGDAERLITVFKKLGEEHSDPLARVAALETPPDRCSLVHGDCHTLNIAIKGDEVMLYDLQLMHEGNSIKDYVQVLSTLFRPAERPEIQDSADQVYYAAFSKTLESFDNVKDPYGSVEALAEERRSE